MSRQYLVQPKGPGTGYQLRMRTPVALLGRRDSAPGKPFGSEVRRGLNTRSLRTAGDRAAILRGHLLTLAEKAAQAVSGGPAQHPGCEHPPELSVDRALGWAEAIAEQAARGSEPDDRHREPDLRDLVQAEAEADARATRRFPLRSPERAFREAARERFLSIAAGRGDPLSKVLESYLTARAPGNLDGFKPLAVTTANDIRSALKHLSAHLGKPLDDILLGDVTPEVAHAFRADYLRDEKHLGHKTVAKHNTLLLGVWRWATEARLSGAPAVNPWTATRSVPRARSRSTDETRTLFSPEEAAKLLVGLPREGRLGDLFRLLLVTGCRVDEVAKLSGADVDPAQATAKHGFEAKGFTISAGKTANAARCAGRLFPEFPIGPASDKAAAASQAFTRERRALLGVETDGRLSLHSTRHTWKILARRARVPEDVVNDLGGWASR